MTVLTTPDATEIYYETHDDWKKMPVVLIHGLGADHSMWDCQIRKYPEIGVFSIIPDVRWHGISTGGGRFRIEDCARDIADILESMGLKRASVVGVSMGGIAVHNQFSGEESEKLVIVGSFSSIGGYAVRFNSKLTIAPDETLFKGSPDKTYKLCISRKRRGDAEDTGIFQGTDIGAGDGQNNKGARRSESI